MFSAAVPLDTATAWRAVCAAARALGGAARASSKRPLYGPGVRPPVARISAIAASIPARSGGEKTTLAAGPPNACPLPQLLGGPGRPATGNRSCFGYRPDLA